MSVEWDYPNPDAERQGRPSGWRWVRIINPYDNELEYYWWGDCKESWKADGSGYVVAQRKRSRLPHDL